MQKWRALREAYLNCIVSDDQPKVSLLRQSRSLLGELPALRRSDNVVLWLGRSLIDQLLVAWLVGEADVLGVDPRKYRVMQIDQRRANNSDVLSIATLNPDELRQFAGEIEPRRVRLDEPRAAWKAVTSPDPDQLVRFCSDNSTKGYPLKDAVSTLLERYPYARTGLSRWDSELLKCCKEVGPRAVVIIGHTLAHNMETKDWPGDWYLFLRLRRLGDPQLRHPLLRLSGRLTRMRSTDAMLTDVGRDVLAGHANFVELNGIDDWVGGVHLSSAAGRMWFHDDGRLARG